MKAIPIKQRGAREFINEHHRHNKAPRGSVFQVGLQGDGELVGVIMVGRPVSRVLDDGATLEVNRTCINGYHKNACSKLLGHAVRAGKALGYGRIITYTLPHESGSSLRGAGWTMEATTKGRSDASSWNNREHRQKQMFQGTGKLRWIKQL